MWRRLYEIIVQIISLVTTLTALSLSCPIISLSFLSFPVVFHFSSRASPSANPNSIPYLPVSHCTALHCPTLHCPTLYCFELQLMQLKEFNPAGCIFMGTGEGQDLDLLEASLNLHRSQHHTGGGAGAGAGPTGGVSAVFTEFPSNPLLKCPDLHR